MVELMKRTREMNGDGTNHHEKLGLKRITSASESTIPDVARRSPDPECNNTDTMSSQPNQARNTPDFSYPLLSSTSFPVSSTISIVDVDDSTIITEQKVTSSFSVTLCDDHELTPSTAYTEYSIHRVQHTPSTASTEDCLCALHSDDQ